MHIFTYTHYAYSQELEEIEVRLEALESAGEGLDIDTSATTSGGDSNGGDGSDVHGDSGDGSASSGSGGTIVGSDVHGNSGEGSGTVVDDENNTISVDDGGSDSGSAMDIAGSVHTATIVNTMHPNNNTTNTVSTTIASTHTTNNSTNTTNSTSGTTNNTITTNTSTTNSGGMSRDAHTQQRLTLMIATLQNAARYASCIVCIVYMLRSVCMLRVI